VKNDTPRIFDCQANGVLDLSQPARFKKSPIGPVRTGANIAKIRGSDSEKENVIPLS
jgi:hypothetical protein